jgi:hypothetical protein
MNTEPRHDEGTVAAPTSSTHFVFEHKLFSMERGYFILSGVRAEPVFNVTLGDLRASIPLPSLCAEFNITPQSNDGKLLAIVEKSLRFVKEIRPNDSIPSELLDGTASWSVEERHRLIAKSRLVLQITSWLSGEEAVAVDIAKLEQLVDDPVTKQRLQIAFSELAERLGLGVDRRQEVVDRIDDLARELAYIEALRERFMSVKAVAAGIQKVAKLYKRDQSVVEDIVRIQTLFRRPLSEFEAQLELIDAHTAEILNVLRKFESQVDFIRQQRDDFNYKLRCWNTMIEKWGAIELARSDKVESLIKETYRFAAQNYPLQHSWRR